MSLKVGEIGKIINVNAKFNLSSETDLKLQFTLPNLTTFTRDKAAGVSAPAVPFTDPDTGTIFAANEYWSYPTATGDITVEGVWKINGIYIDGTPKDFCGDTATFTVLPCG